MEENMEIYAVFLKMRDKEKNQKYREEHLNFLKEKHSLDQVLMYGPYSDGTGGMIIYQGEDSEEVYKLAKQDPYVVKGAREMEIKKWDMKSSYSLKRY